MTAVGLKSFKFAAPFVPFYMKMADGSVHTIHHPELIAIGKRSAVAYHPDAEGFAVLDLDLMTEVGPLGSAKANT